MRLQKLSLFNHSNVVLAILFALFTATSVAWTTSNRRGNETDRLSLLAIKAEIVDNSFQIMRSWNESLHFCQWQGVSCGRKHQRVTRLDLRSLKLEGHISPSIGNLSFIRVLDLANNSLKGEIPCEISRLFRLQYLVLNNNSLVGQIPSNLSCSNLRGLYLEYNNFEGKIPIEMGSLSKLELLTLSVNNLTGNIPPHLGNLSSLKYLQISRNSLEGHIPASLGQLKNLESLRISVNLLSGTMPKSIYNLSQLTDLFLTTNKLEGQLPHDIGLTLPNIRFFVVPENLFSGPLPISFSNMSNLSMLQLGDNNFFGAVPDIFGNFKHLFNLDMDFNNLGSGNANDLNFFASLQNCSSLQQANFNVNKLGGSLPTVLANFSTQLYLLDISNNLISGTIPPGIGNLRSLDALFVDNNLLSGTIPATIGKLSKLELLFLSSNQLSGEIPSSLGNLTLLLKLVLDNNNLHGSIPSSLGNCTNILVLDLANNTLNGTIPLAVIGLSSLSLGLILSSNHLVGSLPSEVGKLVNLDLLDISHNQLSNVIPSTLGGCTLLRGLYMNHNAFKGVIPTSLTSLKGIEEIVLSHNNLSGEFPEGIANLHFLSSLDISFNDLEGELPIEGVFSNASKISVLGNHKLCGGIPQLRLQACAEKDVKRKISFHGGKMIISIVFGILAISLMLYFLSSWWFNKKRKQQIETSPVKPFESISYGDLLKATDGFSLENLIGVGSIGSVYKGILEADQTAIAVKVFNLEKRGALKSFASECEILRGVRHRNLVKIITVCSSIDFQGNEFKALVYELMPNGNLENLLHPSPQTESLSPLTLSKRIDIAIDVATAVDYLHNNVETPILHCDLKPSNILLDEENTAHVGDFGLSRIVPDANAEISNTQPSSSGLKGTVGYAAPEYGMGSKVSKEGDMYSFGILLLEMFTAKKPTDGDFGEEMNLNQYVKGSLHERAMEIVDQGIIPIEDDEATKNNANEQRRKMEIRECCVSVLKIGVMCSDDFPRARMKIDEALRELYAAKKVLFKI